MNSTTLQLLAAPLALAIATPAFAAEKASAPSPWLNSQITKSALKSGHVTANGVSYYYQVHGKGGRRHAEPLLLLHGGLGQIEMFGPNARSGLPAHRFRLARSQCRIGPCVSAGEEPAACVALHHSRHIAR